MNASKRYANLPRAIAIVATAAFLHGCMHWSTKHVQPERFTPEGGPGQVRVTLASGLQLVVQHPFIAGDSLIWMQSHGSPTDTSLVERKGIPLSEIRTVEVYEVNAVGTVLLVAGIGVTVIAIIAAASQPAYGGGSGNGCPCGNCSTGCASCPFVYSWDGKTWRLDSGTFGGAIVRALARSDVDNLEFARPHGDMLQLKLANELDETDHVDALTVLAVDHDSSVTVAPDASGELHSVGAVTLPDRARDFRGRDVLAQVRAADGWNWESAPAGRDTAKAADIRDGLELAFRKPAGVAAARLVIDGNNSPWAASMVRALVSAHGRATQAWYDSLDAAPERARKLFAGLAREAFLSVSIRVGERWEPQGLIAEASPELPKRQILWLDLSRVAGDVVQIRLESIPSFWLIDRVALDFSTEQPLKVTELSAVRAVDEGGRDVREPLASADGHSLSLEPGRFVELAYRVPTMRPHQDRSYLVRSTGWYRIHTPEAGDPNVALLHSVITQPNALSRISVARMNAAIKVMERSGR